MYKAQQENRISTYPGLNILFLQGPAGSFFSRLSKFFKKHDVSTYHINFCMGDKFFNRENNSVDFTGKISNWPQFFENYMIKFKINRVYMLNDCRPYHISILPILQKLNIDYYVFEDGYFRPNYITLESKGVNANSDYYIYDNYDYEPTKNRLEISEPKLSKFFERAIYSILSTTDFLFFNSYQNYRNIDPISRGFGLVQNYFYKLAESSDLKKLMIDGGYIYISLQVEDDTQLAFHSFFKSMDRYLSFVLEGIKKLKPNSTVIVKAHPQNLKSAAILEKKYKDSSNIHFIYSGDYADYLDNAEMAIVNNSTSGIKALQSHKPLFCCSNSVYLKKRYQSIKEVESDFIKFLTHSSNSQSFVNLNKLKIATQIEGKFYR